MEKILNTILIILTATILYLSHEINKSIDNMNTIVQEIKASVDYVPPYTTGE